MEQGLLRQAVELSERIMESYYCQRNINAVLELMASDATWIGPGEREKVYSLDEMRAYLEQGEASVPPCEVSDFDLRAIDLGEDCCMVAGSMTVRTTPESRMILEVDQRVSFVYRHRNGRFEVVHLHNSNPYGAMETEEYFPHKAGSRSYQYLQRLLNEKTEVLDMIAANINGGLKGSNDDSTFSYFYVNEGLPQMLGYTYDEFMEKSGGSAVGAVYPPDLAAALADCEECFARGQVYSTEYRVEKKDGSLIWVLDSGRKVTDSQGVSRINSIITDITPLKQALFDLELERERYRIALEHITGAMCEYDVEKDLFVLYRQADKDGGHSVEETELPCFSQRICSGELSSEKDGAVLLALCRGQQTGIMEFSTRLPYLDDLWHWVQFSCSVISDHAGRPVRTIGILKDITKERNRNLELLKQAQRDGLTGLYNHTTAIELIRMSLTEREETTSPKCALLMVDLDYFKEVNDLNGHAYGDEVLKRTARILEAAAGNDSIVGRIGGDEFLVLVKNREPADVMKMTETIIGNVRNIGADKDFPVTCSIGIACLFREEEEFADFFERADKALYCAKKNGRDRAFIDCPSSNSTDMLYE